MWLFRRLQNFQPPKRPIKSLSGCTEASLLAMWYPTSLKSSKVHFCPRRLSTAGHRHGRKTSLRGFWSAGRRIAGRRAPAAKRKFSLTITAQPHPIKLSGAVACAVSAHAVLNSAADSGLYGINACPRTPCLMLLGEAGSKTSIFYRIRRLATVRNKDGGSLAAT